MTSKWRKNCAVHPSADIFPMMTDQELAELGEDIKANGLKHPIIFQQATADEIGLPVLLDGRNRLEATERAGIDSGWIDKHYHQGDPVAHIIGLNIHRRHLTKQQQAELIVAAIKASEKPDQVDPVSKGGRGKVNPTKTKALAEAKKVDISEATIRRAIAKAEGRVPQPQRYAARPLPKPKSGKPVVGLEAARRLYLDLCDAPDVDLDAEQDIVIDALREIADRKAMAMQGTSDFPELPECMDRRRRP
jgi:hypothetical protein